MRMLKNLWNKLVGRGHRRHPMVTFIGHAEPVVFEDELEEAA